MNDPDERAHTCNETDLNYWLSGNAPVILILLHPDSDAWWVDIKAEFADARRRASRTITVDKPGLWHADQRNLQGDGQRVDRRSGTPRLLSWAELVIAAAVS